MQDMASANTQGTFSQHDRNWRHWLLYCQSFHLDPMNPQPLNVVCFLARQQRDRGYTAALKAVTSITQRLDPWVQHEIQEHYHVKLYRTFLRKKQADKIHKKAPLTWGILTHAFSFLEKNSKLKSDDVRAMAYMAFTYMTCFRPSEAVTLTFGRMKFYDAGF